MWSQASQVKGAVTAVLNLAQAPTRRMLVDQKGLGKPQFSQARRKTSTCGSRILRTTSRVCFRMFVEPGHLRCQRSGTVRASGASRVVTSCSRCGVSTWIERMKISRNATVVDEMPRAPHTLAADIRHECTGSPTAGTPREICAVELCETARIQNIL